MYLGIFQNSIVFGNLGILKNSQVFSKTFRETFRGQEPVVSTYSKFLGDFIVVAGELGQFLFQFSAGGRQVDVDGLEFIDASLSVLISLFSGTLTTESLEFG
jgi:hypothetical protein